MHAASPGSRRVSTALRAAGRSLLRIGVLFLLACLLREVANLDKLLGNASQIVAAHLVTPDYMHRRMARWPAGEQAGKPLVVLLSEGDLAALGYAYPPPYDLHADLLRRLAEDGAQSIFIDFSFKDDRGDRESMAVLEEQIDALAARQPPLPLLLGVFGAPSESSDCWGVVPGLAKRLLEPPGGGCRLARAAGEGGRLSPVNISLDWPGEDGVVLYRDHGADCEPPACAKAPFSPAYALLDEAQRAAAPGTMEIVWVAEPAAAANKQKQCVRGLGSLFTDGLEAARLRCPLIDVLTVTQLLDMDDAPRRALVEGRAIFYGGKLELSGDQWPVALHGQLPGVFVHAMAYDNLMTYGPSGVKHQGAMIAWVKALPASWGVSFYDAMLLLSAVAAVLLPPAARRLRAAIRRSGLWRLARLARLRWCLLPAGLPLLAIALMAWPSSYAGVLAAAALYLLIRATFCPAYLGFLLLGGLLSVAAYLWLDLGPIYVLTWIAMFEVVVMLQAALDGWHRDAHRLRCALPAVAPVLERLVVGVTHAVLCRLTSRRRSPCLSRESSSL
ncbi:CHASE2 domain-containing protein [Azoarcus sp. TTM-91]|uniref:CHASE2 domain-containing protein n=1 Tax=Azoarcus sp. TTM-91 TaxID=2691581 RepID=UPI00145EDF1F|nr:CHASE2 domain-containing protein [Azoarcus sp. TTM-91]